MNAATVSISLFEPISIFLFETNSVVDSMTQSSCTVCDRHLQAFAEAAAVA